MVKHVVIMAGGSGTRLWPASRADAPKQFIDLGTSGGSLFQQTLARALGLHPAGRVLVVTHESQVPAAREQAAAALAAAGGAGAGRRLAILPEPEARNTAAAICCACAWLEARGEGGAPLLVLAADHAIEPQDAFAAAVERAAGLAAGGRLVVFGVRPTRAETGYGYIEAGEPLGDGFVVRSFHEKPDQATARGYLEAGRFYWNSGMFTFSPATFLEEASAVAPAVARPFVEARAALARLEPRDGLIGDDGTLRGLYAALPSIAVDYAVMEKSRRLAMVQADFQWSDVGSWDEVARLGRPRGELASAQAGGNYVLSDIPVAIAGVSDLIVVVRNGVCLVCRRGSSQLVREIVDQVRKKGPAGLL